MERVGRWNDWVEVRKGRLLSRASQEALQAAELFYEQICNNVQLQHSLAFQIYNLLREIPEPPKAPLKRYIGIGYRDKGCSDDSNYSQVEEANKAAIVYAEDALNPVERQALAEFIDSDGWIDMSELPYWVGPLLSVLPVQKNTD
jgi:hypothetical protein